MDSCRIDGLFFNIEKVYTGPYSILYVKGSISLLSMNAGRSSNLSSAMMMTKSGRNLLFSDSISVLIFKI